MTVRRCLLAILALVVCATLATAAPHSSRPHGHLFTAAQRAQLVHQLEDGTPIGLGSAAKDCVICSLVVSLVEQYAWDSNANLTNAASTWCSFATIEIPLLSGVCSSFIDGIVSKLDTDFANKVSPDVSCSQTLAMCPSEYASCVLFPTWPPPAHSTEEPRVGLHAVHDTVHKQHLEIARVAAKLLNVHTITDDLIALKIAELKKAGMELENKGGKWVPVPIPDWDGDKYGSTFTYRGIQWRGQDCNDSDATVYPGRNVFQGTWDAEVDANCNGIYGVDAASGNIPYEEMYCAPYPSRGILAIGDSATAHFSLPPSYVTPADFNASTYAHLIQEVVTEADWPMCSWSTAFVTNDQCPYSILNVSSVYQRMVERNRCMHRDYVNAGVNGASVNNLIEDGPVVPSNYSGAMLGYPLRYKVDGPSTVFFSMVGNDICGTKHWDGYTPVETFAQKALEEFRYLDTILAPKSHVIIMGLVDGRVLYDTLHDAMHPIGTPYPAFYDYLNCLDISPCWGWMNSNETIRDESTRWAMMLNQQYEYIIGNETFENFDLHYIFPDFGTIIAKWVAEGHPATDLIEPVDGFHPSQTGNMLLAAGMWQYMEQQVPDAMGPLNPNNDAIIQQFGNQGGYGM